MAEVIRMPRMSDTMTEGNIVAWHKKEGDKVQPGDLLAEIETDKATMDFESLWEGNLLHIAIKEGAVPVESVIAVIGKQGEDWKAALGGAAANGKPHEPAAEKTAEATQQKAAVPPAEPAQKTMAPPAETAPAAETVPEAAGEKRVKASPLAKSMAKEAGIEIAKVQGSGDQGRIVRKDVEAFLETKETIAVAAPATEAKASTAVPAPAPPAFTYPGGEAFEDKPLSQMRKTIARRLSESKFSAPHFYLTMEINMDNAVAARQRINELAAPAKISFNDMVVKSVAVALRQHPAVNSAWLGDKIRTNQHIHIGVAVAVDEGLLVPVIRHADMKSLTQINQEVKFYAEKARNRKLQPDEMTGSTFSVSNLGMFDIEEFTAIINPPEACILAIGSIAQKPVVKDSQIVIGNIMKVTLSCDHRVVDGATGSKFLQTLKGILEEPLRLLV